MCVTVFDPGAKKNTRPKVKKLFLKAPRFPDTPSPESRKSSINNNVKEMTVSLNQLSCSPVHKSSHSNMTEEQGFEIVKKSSKGLMTQEASQGRTAETGRRGEGGWGRRRHGWDQNLEKVKGGWGRNRTQGGWKGRRNRKKTFSLFNGFDSDMSPDFVPNKKRSYTKVYNKANQSTGLYTQPDQKLRGKQQSSVLSSIHLFSVADLSWLQLLSWGEK